MGRYLAYYQVMLLATTSVIIPCCDKHFRYISDLLTAYAEQTKIPEEVIIALSEAKSTSTEEVENTSWPFSLTILKTEEKLFAGQNRNRGVAAAQGDILIFQDADDLPHPQRVEIISWFFDHQVCNHLLHSWLGPGEEWSMYDNYTIIPWRRPLGFLGIERLKLHHGSVAMRKKIAEQFPWNDEPLSEDRAQTTALYNQRLPGRIVLFAPLIRYYNERSSFRMEEKGTQDNHHSQNLSNRPNHPLSSDPL